MALEGLHALGELGVLCATHLGPQGVHALNTWISQLLDLPQADASGWFAGRPVMVQSNLPQLGLLNGDVGLCVPRRVGDRVQLRVAFAQPQNPQSPVKWLAPSLVHPVQTAWAMTVHKSQGSEFERLLIVVPERDMPLMTREWVYTALTRAKQSVVLWSSQPAVWQAAVQRPTRRQGGLGLSFGDPIRSGVS
jgi:exodeoxyribonuclease V alpha subunit